MSDGPLLRVTPAGLFCEAGGFFIDPLFPVSQAVITHAHADHARAGSRRYLAAACGLQVLRTRLGERAEIETLEYGRDLTLGNVRVSLHPAGHILGSAQVRIEHRGEVWVVSGDYKLGPDPTCAPLEPVRCHTFVTESTFAQPAFHWPAPDSMFAAINAWWRQNQAQGKASVLFAYALGKAQRLLAGVNPAIGPLYMHPAVDAATADYRASGVVLPRAVETSKAPPRTDWSEALIIAPPSAKGTPWQRRLGPCASAFASGWMCVEGEAERRGVQQGFVVSDHADWQSLLSVISATGAERVLATHGFVDDLVSQLRQQGLSAEPLRPAVSQ